MPRLATALYGRTSKDDPKSATIQLQQSRLREWAVRDELVGSLAEYWDEGVSGKIPLGERPAGARLMEDVRAGRVKCVAVIYADRFGRTVLDALRAMSELDRLGVKLVCIQEGWDGRRDASKLNIQLRLVIAEEEHRRINERTTNGKLRAMERDNAPPGGALTFGYRMGPRGEYVPDPAEAAVVIGAFERCLAGWTLRRIAAWAAESGTRVGRKYMKRGEAGEEPRVIEAHAKAGWQASRVSQMLRCRTYLGERRWGERVFPCPALVTQETFDKVQAILAKNRGRRLSRAAAAENSLLSGMLVCENCGSTYYHGRFKVRNVVRRYYRCRAFKGGRELTGCKGKYIPVEWLDAEVWSLVRSYLADPAALVRKIVQADQATGRHVDELQTEEARLEAEAAGCDEEAKGLAAMQREEKLPLDWLRDGLRALRERRAKAVAAAEEIRRQIAAKLLDREESAAVTAGIAAVRAKLRAKMTAAEKAEIVRGLVAGGSIRTVGEGKDRHAEITIHLKWGESAGVGGGPDGDGPGGGGGHCAKAPSTSATQDCATLPQTFVYPAGFSVAACRREIRDVYSH